MGHYVLHHIYKDTLFFGVVVMIAFALLQWSLRWCCKRCGEKWGVRGIGDTAVLPLVLLLGGSSSVFVVNPDLNTQTRNGRGEADMYG